MENVDRPEKSENVATDLLMCCKMMSGHVWCWVACRLEKSVANRFIGNPPVDLPFGAHVRSG